MPDRITKDNIISVFPINGNLVIWYSTPTGPKRKEFAPIEDK